MKYLREDPAWSEADADHRFLTGTAAWVRPELSSEPFTLKDAGDTYELTFTDDFEYNFKHWGEVLVIEDLSGKYNTTWEPSVGGKQVWLVYKSEKWALVNPGGRLEGVSGKTVMGDVYGCDTFSGISQGGQYDGVGYYRVSASSGTMAFIPSYYPMRNQELTSLTLKIDGRNITYNGDTVTVPAQYAISPGGTLLVIGGDPDDPSTMTMATFGSDGRLQQLEMYGGEF